MIKPSLFEFLPELGGPSVEPNPQDVATLFGRYLDYGFMMRRLALKAYFSASIILVDRTRRPPTS